MTKIAHVALILMVLSGCDDTSSREGPIPADVTYTIINQSSMLNIKKSLDIRLNKKVSEGALKTIALALRESDLKSYERTFIVYYLADMEVGAVGWATSHFNPDLKIRILGLTVEQEQALKQEPEDMSRNVVGRWLDESPFVGNRTTIFQKNGKLYMENVYKDGSRGETELIDKKSSFGRRFDKADGSGSDSGAHWILDSNGDLQLRDSMGWISTAKKLD